MEMKSIHSVLILTLKICIFTTFNTAVFCTLRFCITDKKRRQKKSTARLTFNRCITCLSVNTFKTCATTSTTVLLVYYKQYLSQSYDYGFAKWVEDILRIFRPPRGIPTVLYAVKPANEFRRVRSGRKKPLRVKTTSTFKHYIGLCVLQRLSLSNHDAG